MTDGENRRDGMESRVDENRGASAIRVPDVELREALKRLLGETGNRDMHTLVYKASKMGEQTEPKWYKKMILNPLFVSIVSPTILLLGQYFFFIHSVEQSSLAQVSFSTFPLV